MSERHDNDISKIRKAHRIVINAGGVLTREQINFLRSMLPPLPKQKKLEEITDHVYDVWVDTHDNDWAGTEENPDIPLEHWLAELHTQLQGVNNALHPEFLETEEDYDNAPDGTMVARDGNFVPMVKNYIWPISMLPTRRRVLRWGMGE